MTQPAPHLTPRLTIAILAGALLFGAPAMFMVERQVGPAHWLIDIQDRFLGGHFIVSTMVLVMGFELLVVGVLLLVVAIAVRAATGRTLVDVATTLIRR